ncbi:Alpha/beta hydrolase family-domain-containing protein [Dactylonectria estremocensis]|uniref:Alpha/beta hydrolase family-domain-containing protein n=1 Tax=Dactylonectria estremocensis TaxID=1079267 RepID=A0A9P9FD21_9HYPO|nr:Alpha/beta hydrolase family-domain-containing protein [Dactylonectria estremocensis]
MSAIFDIQEHTIEASHIREFARATANSQDEKLLLHVKQYTPKDNRNPQKGDVTIIGGHANGFPKELYEPLWEEFYQEAKSRNVRIRSIWIADTAWQGKSGVLNQNALGNDPGWLDYARDILHMINTFRPPPPIMGMGHSFGGNALANVSLLHPRLLSSLVLLDPVISHYASSPDSKAVSPAAASMHRRDVWPSLDDAKAAFGRSPFYKSWDPRVLERWVDFGIRNVPGQDAVTLTTTKHQEVFTFLRPSWDAYDAQGKTLVHPELVPDLNPSLNAKWPTYPLYRAEGANTVERLPNVRPSVLYVFGGKSDISPVNLQDEKMALTGSGLGGSGGAKAGRVKRIVGDEYGHLIPMEGPKFCARAAAEWIEAELQRWWVEERKYEEWTRRPVVEKTTISEEWHKHLRRPERKNSKDKAKI